jgi:hypothetical protein
LRRAIYRQPGGAPALVAHPYADADADLHAYFDRQPHPLADHHAYPIQYTEDAHWNADQDPHTYGDADRYANLYPIALANRNFAALGDVYKYACAAYIHKHIGVTYLHKYARAAHVNQHSCDPIGYTRSAHGYPQSLCDVTHTDRPVWIGQFANSWSALA